MGTPTEKQHRGPLHGKAWRYIAIAMFNLLVFACVFFVYVSNSRNSGEKLYNENLKSVENLNAASANAAENYILSMGIKLDDAVGYMRSKGLSYDEALGYLGESNSSPERTFQLILSAHDEDGALKKGDYSGVSVRRELFSDGNLITMKREISYNSNYKDLVQAFDDLQDENFSGVCTAPEFTDADTKLKTFALYRHVELPDAEGVKAHYTVLLAVKSSLALQAINLQHEFDGQSTVLINSSGDYIIKSSYFKGLNFYEYLQLYNDLTLDERTGVHKSVLSCADGDGESSSCINLFYTNHEGKPCVFCVAAMPNSWYCVTSVPLSSFSTAQDEINYSLIILLLFLCLFAVDGIAIFFVAKMLQHNVTVAREAQAAADSANLAKSKFLSTMSHELRTPLNAIIGLVSLSRDNINSPSVLSDYLGKMYSSSKLLLQLISDILDVSAIESDKLKLTNAEFDLTKLISSTSAIYYSQCNAKGIEFDVILKNFSNERFIGDSIRLNQILLNFLSNSVKFTPQGGKITLKVEQTPQTDSTVILRFDIIDTGCGISDELKTRLFKPFEQAAGIEARRHGGSGLGLSIAKNLIELMGGHVEMESEEGKGSCFSAIIPLELPAENAHNRFSPLDGMHIVAAIGDDDGREYLGQILSGFGIEHSLTHTVGDAAALLREAEASGKPYNLCILDWKLSDLDAVDATAMLREQFSPELLIMVLAYDMAAAKPPCHRAGANTVFEKPVFPSSLYNALEELSTGNAKTATSDLQERSELLGKHVLLVEDNKLNIEIAVLMLKKFGLEVEVAENGELGFETLRSSPAGHFDAILMDVQMPVMDGYEATRAIRGCDHPDAATIPILAMTADAFSEDVDKAKAAGMNAHLSKPIEPDTLYSTLKSFLA